MIRSTRFRIVLCCALAVVSRSAFAGGPWVTEPGHWSLYFGYSRKTGINSWDNAGNHVTPDPSTLANGLRHDFRYGYLNPTFGIVKDLEVGGSFLYLWGYESTTANPNPAGAALPLHMEYNPGLTDFWLDAKYQILHGDYPLAVMVNSRFPDFYDQEGPYTRYVQRIYSIGSGKTATRDTQYAPSSEWRGVLKHDLGVYVMSGRSFGSTGYAQAQLGYVLRQGAYADQVYVEVDGGYNIPVLHDGQLLVKAQFDYTGGVGNGGAPTEDDRFARFDPTTHAPVTNYNFNNGKYGRIYGSVVCTPSYDLHTSFELGLGRWIFGTGAVQYTEVYFQTGYAL